MKIKSAKYGNFIIDSNGNNNFVTVISGKEQTACLNIEMNMNKNDIPALYHLLPLLTYVAFYCARTTYTNLNMLCKI